MNLRTDMKTAIFSFMIILIACSISIASPVTLEALEERVSALEKQFNIQINGMRQEVVLAKQNLDHRLNSMNEIRNQLNAQAATFATKADIEKIELKVDLLKEASAKAEGSELWTRWFITAAIAVLMAWIVNKGLGRKNGLNEPGKSAQ